MTAECVTCGRNDWVVEVDGQRYCTRHVPAVSAPPPAPPTRATREVRIAAMDAASRLHGDGSGWRKHPEAVIKTAEMIEQWIWRPGPSKDEG